MSLKNRLCCRLSRITFFCLPILFFALASAYTEMAAPQMHHVCGKEWVQLLSYEWCIDYPENRTNPDVLYYLHGIGRSVHDWRDSTDNKAIQAQWTKLRTSPPTVITISFGSAWLLSDLGGFLMPALYPTFFNEIMPKLERLIGGVHGRRMLKGESMGGFNASQLYLKSGQAFDRAVLLCPAITTLGPFAPLEQIEQQMVRSRGAINRNLVFAFQFWSFQVFPSPAIWSVHDPLQMVRHLVSSAKPLYISAGKRDEFGFYEGTVKFASQARARGAKVTWHSSVGGHCSSQDAVAIARFLAPQN